MPRYTYRCESCGQELEARQRMTDAPLTVCPRCGDEGLRRVINSVGVVFKGSGFYVTDNRNGKSAARSSTATPANGATASAESTATPAASSKSEKSGSADSAE